MNVQVRSELCACGSGLQSEKCCAGKSSLSTNSAPKSADQWVHIGLSNHQAGQLTQANEAYQRALKENPNHPDALHLLGMVAHQIGDHTLAEELIGMALSINPVSPNYHSNLGTVLQAQRKYDAAGAHFRQAIAIEPNNAIFHFNLGYCLQTQGKLPDAIASYQSAIVSVPDHIASHSNLGHTFRALGEWDQAIDSYRKAISIAPNLAEMHFNLAVALGAQGKLDTAIKSYREAILLSADYAQAHCNLGAALLAQKKFDEAILSYQRAIAIKSDLSEAHYNLGIALQAQDKFDDAIASFRKTLELQPKFVEGYCNLGNVLRAKGCLEEALDCYKKALVIKPDYANAYSNLLFLLSYHAVTTPLDYLIHARGWELACVPAEIRKAAHDRLFTRAPLAGRRLKVGYVSGDFRKHAASYFMEQLFSCHDRSRIELFAYSNNRTRDDVTERLNILAEHWIPIATMSDAQVCERIEADKIDVLIDLSAHTAHNRLGVFARRAAPVQATYLYFASTGLSEMDYWIGDEILAPVELNNQFSETIWRLPRVWLAYKTITEAPIPGWHPAADGKIRLGCFNNLGKITPHTLLVWAQILNAMPEGRLLIKNKELTDAGNRQYILSEMALHGIDAGRIELQPGSNWHEYMAQHDQLDIALDPIGGHGGGTSTCDALWMGVPVIHLQGDHVGSRFSASLLTAIGRSEWIAHSENEYVEKVITLARNVEHRKQLRLEQRNIMSLSPLCDAQGLARSLEDAYSRMFTHGLDSSITLNPAI